MFYDIIEMCRNGIRMNMTMKAGKYDKTGKHPFDRDARLR